MCFLVFITPTTNDIYHYHGQDREAGFNVCPSIQHKCHHRHHHRHSIWHKQELGNLAGLVFFLLDSDGLISSWLFRLDLVLFHTPFRAVHDGSPSRFLTCFYHSLLGSLSIMGLVVLRTMCSVGWERYNGWDRKEGHGKETA
ncbi:hypothetical protein BGZ61DRAFT_61837 [Ilyonectria robusta]|uniref:uncharacterized protein n=1 Tax=Ilyonectria robusta TaxID=1079257 RepID=UPI001E8DBEB3|nr:uncharacterized protein BGZ61DRAFT_61837 [Ilyonectria robusta]KAH8683425.1 hypothetical protein BGZ61DRAFT_61837 [Ilyonectria robusta]